MYITLIVQTATIRTTCNTCKICMCVHACHDDIYMCTYWYKCVFTCMCTDLYTCVFTCI